MRESRIILFAFPVLCLLLPWAQARAQEQDGVPPVSVKVYQEIQKEAEERQSRWLSEATDELQRNVQWCYKSMVGSKQGSLVVTQYNEFRDADSALAIFVRHMIQESKADHNVLYGVLLVGLTKGNELVWSFVEQYNGNYPIYGACAS